ncbi:hypothetical protein [Allopusillimonas ginsengisoli]|uniref:P-type ATPase n=1 Tax=Allopusillimonas ginsengisoli TaxID=453575 RepID=UPI00102146EA|nr:hypothetical protein [Allopusillimonas ginsengisoli]TEA77369.1 hypothetical protein ERE07_15610 [Allopusillimonas ginsengisoli]
MRPYSIFSTPQVLSDEDRLARRRLLARMGLAWLGMMQVMMFAFPGYLRSERMAPDNLALLDQAIYLMNWISLVLTVPVALYCASPVWRGAWAQIRQWQIGMDVPVALGIAAAFAPSAYATLAGQGEVYFDSVVMFVAFLLTARYLELCARQSVEAGEGHALIEQLRSTLSVRANRVAFWFVLVQLGLAFLVGGVWLFHAPERAIGVMVALFVMSCPCAMAMAVPTAVAAAHAALCAKPISPADQRLLAKATQRVARQNLFCSVAWHLLMTPLAAGGLMAPWVAAITMLLSSLAVAANSWRIYRRAVRRPTRAWLPAAAQG